MPKTTCYISFKGSLPYVAVFLNGFTVVNGEAQIWNEMSEKILKISSDPEQRLTGKAEKSQLGRNSGLEVYIHEG